MKKPNVCGQSNQKAKQIPREKIMKKLHHSNLLKPKQPKMRSLRYSYCHLLQTPMTFQHHHIQSLRAIFQKLMHPISQIMTSPQLQPWGTSSQTKRLLLTVRMLPVKARTKDASARFVPSLAPTYRGTSPPNIPTISLQRQNKWLSFTSTISSVTDKRERKKCADSSALIRSVAPSLPD